LKQVGEALPGSAMAVAEEAKSNNNVLIICFIVMGLLTGFLYF